jgi:hypothetical protein
MTNEKARGGKSTGYSGTPLAKKLGLFEGCSVFAIGAPPHYRELLDPLPARVRFVRRLEPGTDVVHLFVRKRSALAEQLRGLYAAIRTDAAIWVSWPKKAAKVETDITEDTLRAVALPLGLVDVKVCAVDETWSGLKLVIRAANRSRAR